MVGSPNLTDESASWLATKPGQAHYARVDTSNTCRECVLWGNEKGERTSLGLLKPGLCLKARGMTNLDLPPVPHEAWACRHFEAAPHPPEV